MENSLTSHRPVKSLEMAARRESAFRMGGAVVLALTSLMFNLGLTWDVQWHADVGPDSFWTAPHTLMYGGTAITGLVALGVVILTTIKFYRGDSGVTEANTSKWIFGLRGPLGFLVAGHGALGFLLSGMFDL